MRLKNKICIVTGAAQGIGAATCAKFAAEGATVIACDRRAQPIEGAAEEGGQQRHHRAAGHGNLGQVHRGQQRKVSRAQAAGGGKPVAHLEILPQGADMDGFFQTIAQRDPVAVSGDIFLQNHAVGPRWPW